jgi:hypothetical protein
MALTDDQQKELQTKLAAATASINLNPFKPEENYIDKNELLKAVLEASKPYTDILEGVKNQLQIKGNPAPLKDRLYLDYAQMLQPSIEQTRKAVLFKTDDAGNDVLRTTDPNINTWGSNVTIYGKDKDGTIQLGLIERVNPLANNASDGYGATGGLADICRHTQEEINKMVESGKTDELLLQNNKEKNLDKHLNPWDNLDITYDNNKITKIELLTSKTENEVRAITTRTFIRETLEEIGPDAMKTLIESLKNNEINKEEMKNAVDNLKTPGQVSSDAIKTLTAGFMKAASVDIQPSFDPSYILKYWDVTEHKKPEDVFIVNPRCHSVEVDNIKFFEKAKAEVEKLVGSKTSSHQEVNSYAMMPVTEALTRFGLLITGNGKKLSCHDNSQYKHTYKYPHEAMVPWKIAIANAGKDANAVLQLVEDAQNSMLNSQHTYQIDFTEYANRMFPREKDPMETLAGQFKIGKTLLEKMQQKAEDIVISKVADKSANKLVLKNNKPSVLKPTAEP